MDVTFETSTDNESWTPLSGSTFTIPDTASESYTIYVKAKKAGLTDSEVLPLTYTISSGSSVTISTIAAAKTADVGTENITVEGTVTLVSGKNVYVQDATGGIDLYFSSTPTGIAVGDVVRATGKRASFSGLEELSGVTTYEKIGTATELPSKTVIIAEILADQTAGALESTRVYIESAVIGAVNTSGNTTLTQGETTINVYKIPALNGIGEGDTVSLYAVISDFNGYQLLVAAAADVTLVAKGEGGGEEETTGATATLVTDISELAAGNQIVIVASGSDKALSTTQNTNNRGEADVTKDSVLQTVTFGEDVQVLTLAAGTKEGTFAFNTGSNYLCAASSSSNYLKTETTLSDNSSWSIAIDTSGVATVKAQGAYTRNWLRYNSASKIFSCYASGQQDISIYKLNAEPSAPTRMATAPKQLDKVYIYNPDSGMVLTGTVNGKKLAGTAGSIADEQLTVTDDMLELVVSVDENGRYSFITADGKYLTSGATGNSLTLAGAASDYSLWTLSEQGDGYVINNVNAVYNDNQQAIEYYNNFTTYATGTSNAYIMQFFKSGEAAELPSGGEEEEPETPVITDGKYVIWAPAHNMALSGNYNGFYNKGVVVTESGGTLTGYDNSEIWTVTSNGDGTYCISYGGKNLAMADSFSSLTLGEKHDKWVLEDAGDGCYHVKNTGRNCYIQWYKDKNYWSGYGTIAAGSEDLFALRFTPATVQYDTDSSVVEAIAAWGGGGPYDDTANALVIFGDKYVSGDQKDTGAKYTVVAGGAPAKPFQTSVSSNTGGTNYYMGGANVGKAEGDYAQFTVSTAGWGDMELSFRMRATNAAPGSFQLQYSVDNGATFRNFTTGSYSYAYTQYTSDGSFPVTGEGKITDGVAKTSLAPTYYITFNFDVPAGAENAENLLIRLVPGTERASGTGAISGNIRIDSVVLSGSPIVDDSITGYVTVDPDGAEEDQAPGTELTMTCATDGATILYRFVDTTDGSGEWQIYNDSSKPVLPATLPATLEVKATCTGKVDSVTRIFTYAAGSVSAVKMSPNGGGVYIPGESTTVTLTCDTAGADIYYRIRVSGGEDFTLYTEPLTLKKGFGSMTLEAYAVREGFKDSPVTKRDFTEMDSDKYAIYFGQLHSHTNISDGAGSIQDAYAHASQVSNLDFLAVTDHSNSFDGSSDTLSTDALETSPEWAEAKAAAKAITTENFVGIYGFEMTWSNGLGHINTYNTPGWQSRTQNNYSTYGTALENYYDELKTVSDSLSQFNHPGTTFGDFEDFAHYDAEIDELITMIEVGNGEGAIGSSGYFPSYEYYTRALDKGWHVAPSNNQDNHKGNWGDANTGRTVVLATSLTESAIYDAIRNYRVYATEDNDLSVYYTLDGNIMGTILDKSDVGETVTLTVDITDPTDSAIGRVEVIVNGGLSLASQTVSGSTDTVIFEVPSIYNYYYIKITQADGDIAVTAPVWIGNVEAVGVSSFTAGSELTVVGEEQTFTLELYNNESKALEVTSVTFMNKATGETIHTDKTITSVPKLGTASCSFGYTFATDGIITITATVKGVLNGVEKVYTQDLELSVMPAQIVGKILVDGTHYNDYVTGYYGGNMSNMTTIAAESGVKVEVVTDTITKEMLADCSLLVISAPARKSGTANAGAYTASTFEDSFIELVADYVKNGGSVVVCGLADYQDKSADYGAEGHAAAQINKLLAAIGSTMSINDDEVYDAENNGGQFYRLYPENFNTESAWTDGIVVGQTYSQYSGCSVNPGDGTWLVRGFETTYSVDSDMDGVGNTDKIETDDSYGYNIVTPKGEVVFLACEETAYGGTIFAAGGVFLSDFEVKAEMDNIWDLPYANRTIYENIMNTLCATTKVTPIAQVREADLNRIFVVEGYVTNGTADENTTFFDAIYVQDETGGTTVFPYSTPGLEIGTKVRIIGYTDEYQGDREIQILSLRVLNDAPNVYAPKELSTKDAMDYDTYGGQLVKTTGTVSDIVLSGGLVSQFKLTDDTGVAATVFIDGYITNPEGVNSIGTWLKEGQTVSAVGLLYKHPEGSSDVSVPVLRVRNCDEILRINNTLPVVPSTPSASGSGTASDVVGMPFNDVHITDWFYGDVKYVYENGIMNGTGVSKFEPEANLTRGMIVTILYRLEGEPGVRFDGAFGDVKDGLWYSDPVEWAAANGIVNGYTTGDFGPTDPITREQLAAILYRYAQYKGYDVSVGEDTNILSYTDAFDVSEYAIPAMQWACGAGLINGSNGMLMPKANASRAQVAAIIHRFLEK